MQNKIIVSLISLFCITHYTYALPFVGKIPKELKAWVIMFGKMTILVILSILIIWAGLNIYKKYLENKLAQPTNQDPQEKKVSTPKALKQNRSKNSNFKCEIDDVKNMDEAINIFLTIDNQH